MFFYSTYLAREIDKLKEEDMHMIQLGLNYNAKLAKANTPITIKAPYVPTIPVANFKIENFLTFTS